MSKNPMFFCDYCTSSNISFDFPGLRGHLTRFHKIEAKQSFLFSIILAQYDEDEKLTSLLQALVDQTKIILKPILLLFFARLHKAFLTSNSLSNSFRFFLQT